MTPSPRSERRAVVFGPYAGSPLPGADVTLATVRGLVAAGAAVEVVSPDISAAHHHLDVGGIKDTVRFARLVAGADTVVMYLSPAVFVPGGRRSRQRGARALLGLALGRVGAATVHLPPLPRNCDPEFVRLVAGRAGRVVAATGVDRDRAAAAGIDPGRLSVAGEAAVGPVDPVASDTPTLGGAALAGMAGPSAPPRPGAGRAPWPEALVGRAEIEAEVARRAALDRGGVAPVSAGAGSVGSRPRPAVSLSALPPLIPANPFSDRRLVRLVKDTVRRFTAWEVDPVIDHVNVLHRAVQESLPER